MKYKNKNFIIYALLLTIVLFWFYSHQKTENRLKQSYLIQAKLASSQTAKLVQEQVKSIKDELEVMAQSPEILNASSDQKSCQKKVLQTYRHIEDKIGNLGVINKNGVFQCSINNQLLGQKAENFGDFFKIIKEDTNHLPVLSRYFIPPGQMGLGSALHVAVINEKNFLGTVGAGIYFGSINEKFFKNLPFFKHGYITLFDDNGDILYNEDSWSLGKNIWAEEILQRFGLNAEFAEAAKKSAGGIMQSFVIKQGSGLTLNEKFLAVDMRPINLLPDRRWVIMTTIPFSDEE